MSVFFIICKTNITDSVCVSSLQLTHSVYSKSPLESYTNSTSGRFIKCIASFAAYKTLLQSLDLLYRIPKRSTVATNPNELYNYQTQSILNFIRNEQQLL